ncbi:cytochrome P450 [Lentzea sp. BCCO 10_0856]|uniref:Cytochrome P450 n=1 Tax=Lentzea miocenica TaxID=3095431 RepID=A0ABU4SVK8_9PSEU|nr:cytochrome P450 [Lentzea sp. BCCO 10_0856]MDX8029932.1 cytochrome P450 [Lentzea sp. BCCO 10_0856]
MSATFPFTTPRSLDNEPEAQTLLASEGPVVLAKMGPIDIWLALSYAACKQVLTDPRFSREEATRPGGPVTIPSAANPLVLTSMEGGKHARTRKLVASAFSPRMVATLEPRVQAIVDALLDAHPADLVAGLCTPLPTMVICELLGAPYSDAPDIRRWTGVLMTSVLTPEELRQAENDMQGFLADLVEEKRVRPDDKLITALVEAHDEGGHLTSAEMLANLQMLLAAGHDTTVNQLGNSLLTLLRHPAEMRRLIDDPSLIDTAVDELLRYSRLMAATLPRVTTEAVELAGVRLEKGAAVLPILSSANRDPSVFPDPDRLDLGRAGAAPLAMGFGPHYCLGAQLAKLELRIALTSVLKRFPGLRLAVDESELAYRMETNVRALVSLPVTW